MISLYHFFWFSLTINGIYSHFLSFSLLNLWILSNLSSIIFILSFTVCFFPIQQNDASLLIWNSSLLSFPNNRSRNSRFVPNTTGVIFSSFNLFWTEDNREYNPFNFLSFLSFLIISAWKRRGYNPLLSHVGCSLLHLHSLLWRETDWDLSSILTAFLYRRENNPFIARQCNV